METHHVIQEAMGDYRERMNSGNFLFYIIGGLVLVVLGLILFSFATGIVDRLLFILMIVGGVWVMWKGVKPSEKRRYRDTAQRISYG